mmetsp:Transcript_22512/g.55006  ORF Transcript_22512/g.55006 Transcript_22512/m.55006 type:complete len:221 (+) Transcript_22512:721-1383(+)
MICPSSPMQRLSTLYAASWALVLTESLTTFRSGPWPQPVWARSTRAHWRGSPSPLRSSVPAWMSRLPSTFLLSAFSFPQLSASWASRPTWWAPLMSTPPDSLRSLTMSTKVRILPSFEHFMARCEVYTCRRSTNGTPHRTSWSWSGSTVKSSSTRACRFAPRTLSSLKSASSALSRNYWKRASSTAILTLRISFAPPMADLPTSTLGWCRLSPTPSWRAS